MSIQIGFTKPSNSYNIVLTKEELDMLIIGKIVKYIPRKTETRFGHGSGINKLWPINYFKRKGHELIIVGTTNKSEGEPIQFVNIIVDESR